jgi:hypothetical protein
LLHTYQSRRGELADEDDSTNHGCFELVRLGGELGEVGVVAVVGVDVVVVAGIVAVVAGRAEDGHQPERVDAQIGVGLGVAVVEVVEAGDEPAQVAFAVAVGVLEAAHEDLVEHRAVGPAGQRWIASAGGGLGCGAGAGDDASECGQAHGVRV